MACSGIYTLHEILRQKLLERMSAGNRKRDLLINMTKSATACMMDFEADSAMDVPQFARFTSMMGGIFKVMQINNIIENAGAYYNYYLRIRWLLAKAKTLAEKEGGTFLLCTML